MPNWAYGAAVAAFLAVSILRAFIHAAYTIAVSDVIVKKANDVNFTFFGNFLGVFSMFGYFSGIFKW
jgi:hypothetical protein